MNTLKLISKRLVLFLGMAVFLLLSSCEKDPVNIDDRTQWLGSWICNETSGDFSPQSYSISIVEGTNLDEVIIRGLHNEDASFAVLANVYNFQLILSTQTVNDLTINGSGTINSSGSRVDMTFTFNDGSGDDHVTAYWTR